MSYESKLLQMKKLVKKAKDAVPKQETEKKRKPAAPHYETEWLSMGFGKTENEYGAVYTRTVVYPHDYRHGDILLSDIAGIIDSSRDEHPLSPHADRPLLFFDTETTGLKGAGTLIFLMGFIEYTGGQFTLTQYILPDPSHEAAFLYASKLWGASRSVVMYNGKSFDMPLLRSRWTMNRRELPPLSDHTEIDLLHGSKRIWKNEMETFRLKAVEEEQLGFFREDDVPGHLAPVIYMDAVKNGRADLLLKVLLHNEWDILSLVTLFIRSISLLDRTAEQYSHNSYTNIGKWYADLKSYSESKMVLEQVIKETGEDHPASHYHIAFLYKKEEDYLRAIASFETAAKGMSGREKIISYVELAKLFEHKEKVLSSALHYTRKAQNALHEEDLTKRFISRMETDLNKREMRIKRKLFPGQAQ